MKQLPEGVTPVVWRIAWGFHKRYPKYDVNDLAQIGFVACMRAIPKYDPSRGTKLTTWITTAVVNDIKTLISRGSQTPTSINACDQCVAKDTFDSLAIKDVCQVLESRLSPLAYKLMRIAVASVPNRVSCQVLAEQMNLTPSQVRVLRREVGAECRELCRRRAL